MPIRIDKPVGSDWQYSLDQANWQISNVFDKAAGGVDFIVGNVYLVYCRNQVQNAFSQDAIIFGDKNNQTPTLDQVAKTGSAAHMGITDALVKLLGGLFLGNIPTTTENFPQLVLDADGKVWKREGSVVTPPPVRSNAFRNFQHYEFVPKVVAEAPKIARIDVNDCQRITGWGYGGPLRIERDGVPVAYINPTIARPDVVSYLATQGITADSDELGFVYYKSASESAGTHTWEVFVGSSSVKATTDVGAPTSVTCSVPDPSNPAPSLANPTDNWTITAFNGTSKVLAQNQFSDNAGDTGTLRAYFYNEQLKSYMSLPDWLVFDPATRTFAQPPAGTPNQTLTIRVVYVDSAYQSADDEFELKIDVPVTVVPLITQVKRNWSGSSVLYSVYGNNLNIGSGDPFGLQIRWKVGEQDSWSAWEGPASATASVPGTFGKNVDPDTTTVFEVRIVSAQGSVRAGSTLQFAFTTTASAQAQTTVYPTE
ncbi:hypothetical protein [Spirosoma sp.]|uniref:hypothetical protein n=1 Tax=Spirosoma sp. TaxID=1899569 RepID=UPI00261BAA0B|nr:hypothetical protein [Spirosoma sp.]MCX6216494.1 hypothetical protein [Spirosoma sp.]